MIAEHLLASFDWRYALCTAGGLWLGIMIGWGLWNHFRRPSGFDPSRGRG